MERKKNRKWDSLPYFLFTLPAVIAFSIFFTLPALLGFFYSLTDWNGISASYHIVGLQNYFDMFGDKDFLSALSFTIKYACIIMVGIILLALGIAMLLNRKIRFRGFFRTVYFFPAVLSLITVGLIFNQIFYAALPPIGKTLGIEALSKNILGSRSTAIWGIAATNIWQGIAMPTIIFLSGLQAVPTELHEAARIDGATGWQRFWSITFPFLIPMLNVNLVLVLKSGLTVFDYIRAMTDGGPGKVTQSIALLIFKNGFQNLKFGYGAAESIVLLLMVLVISLIQVKFLNKREVGQI